MKKNINTKKNKRTIWLVIFFILGVVLFIHAIYTAGIKNIIDSIVKFSLTHFLILLVLSLLNFYLYSLRWEIIVGSIHKEKKLPSMIFFWNRLAAYAMSYITPSAQLGGEPLRVILTIDEGIPKNKAVSSTIIDKAFESSVLILFISFGTLTAAFDSNIGMTGKPFLILISLILIFIVFWFYYTSFKNIGFLSSLFKIFKISKIKKLKNFENKLNIFEKEMNQFYHENAKEMWKLILISIITISFLLVEHFIVAYFMGVKLTFLQVFLASTVPYIAYFLPLPGGIGVLESGHATMFMLLGVNINAIAFVFIIRLRDFVLVALGLGRIWYKGLKILKKN